MFRPSEMASRNRGVDHHLRRNVPPPEQPSKELSALTSKTQTDAQDLTLINAFQTHVDDMRNLIMCKICIRPLYEPFSLGCGHTYCYSCLSEWFGSKSNRRKRNNCPDCRTEVKIQPAPNYLLRELVHMFVSRLELLDREETLQGHHEAMLAEAGQVEKDKNDKSENGGLFKGVFKALSLNAVWQRGMIRDDEDGVDRCPRCTWEMEDGHCNQCGYGAGWPFSDDEDEHDYSTDYDGDDFGESDLDGDMDLEDGDAFGYGFGLHHHATLPIHREGHRHRNPGAMANRAISVTSDSETDHTATLDGQARRPFHGVYSDDESEEEDETGSEMRSFIDDDEIEEEDSDESTIRTRSPRSPISVSSDPVDDGRVGYDFSTTDSLNSEQEDSEEEEDEVEEDVVHPSRKPPGRILRRNRLVVDSSDEENSGGSGSVGRTTNEDDSERDTSEGPTFTTHLPPRPSADRRARREAQRARRHR